MQCLCKPDVIHSLSQVDVTCDCCYWLYQALQPVCPRDQCRCCAFQSSQQSPKAGREEAGKSYSKDRQKKPVPNKLSSKTCSKKTPSPQYFKENNCKMQWRSVMHACLMTADARQCVYLSLPHKGTLSFLTKEVTC